MTRRARDGGLYFADGRIAGAWAVRFVALASKLGIIVWVLF